MFNKRPWGAVWIVFSVLVFALGSEAFPQGGRETRGESADRQPPKEALKIPKAGEEWFYKMSKEGIQVEMAVRSVEGSRRESDEVREGEEVEMRFRLTDTATGNLLTGVGPSAWIDPRQSRMDPQKGEPVVTSCEEKVKWFLQGSLSLQPAVDLNTYYILALNESAGISVINPQLGFYISKLLTLIPLKSPGEDWVLNKEGKRLYVTLPDSNAVAVIDTETWKVITYLDTVFSPVSIALQPDEKYFWVELSSRELDKFPGGVSVWDAVSLSEEARIATGAGSHEIAFSDDSRHAFISNGADGTVSVVDVLTLKRTKNIQTGKSPVSLAYSRTAKTLYVAHEADGRIVVIDGRNHGVLKTIVTRPGLRSVRFSQDGRWAFAVNMPESVVTIIDSSDNSIAYEIPVEARPDQVAFSSAFAYIRSTASDHVNAIQLSLLGKEKTITPMRFPSGQVFSEKAVATSHADAIVPTPEGDVVLVASPADKTIYYYMEGMLAPMGHFQNYGREPRAVLVVDRSLKETAPGVYSTTFQLPGKGRYDVAFLLDSPLMHLCFEMDVKANPAFVKEKGLSAQLEFLPGERKVTAGQNVKVAVKVTDPATGRALPDIKDIHVLFTLVPGTWQRRVWATSVGDGRYEVEMALPQSGYYNVFFESPSLKVPFRDWPHLVVQAIKEGIAGEAKGVFPGSPASSSAHPGEAPATSPTWAEGGPTPQ